MTAFLLIWSPKKWPWPELPDVARRVAAGEAVTDVWGCGFSRSILPGDRVFIHRVTLEPKGVFASGYVTRAPYEMRLPPSRYQRICSGERDRSISTAYVWKALWQPGQECSPLPMPVDSWQGPPGSEPQCRVLKPRLTLGDVSRALVKLHPDENDERLPQHVSTGKPE